MIKREEIVLKDREGRCSEGASHYTAYSPMRDELKKIANAKRVTLVIETEEKSLGEVARDASIRHIRRHGASQSGMGETWSEASLTVQGRWESIGQAVLDAAIARGVVKRV